jgi:uncharacterized protein YecT (DUF1311 family)
LQGFVGLLHASFAIERNTYKKGPAMLRFAIFLVTVMSCLAAAAESSDRCGNLSGQQAMNACISDEVSKADNTLNGIYKRLHDKLNESGKRNLVGAERAWITFRDKECMLESGYDIEHPENNGTIAPFTVGECKLSLTNERTTTLRQLLKCPGGDMTC